MIDVLCEAKLLYVVGDEINSMKPLVRFSSARLSTVRYLPTVVVLRWKRREASQKEGEAKKVAPEYS
jgi:hypothetical protein